MARKGRGRKDFSKYMKGGIDVNSALGTLGPKDVIAAIGAGLVVDTTRVSSVKCVYTLSDFTPVVNAGPIICGVAHGDYTDAEIEEWIENSAAWDMGDMIAKEIASRRIRQIGVFDTAAAATQSVRLNDGKPITTKLNWLLAEGDGLKWWAYNAGPAALTTTDPNLHVTGHANLWQV